MSRSTLGAAGPVSETESPLLLPATGGIGDLGASFVSPAAFIGNSDVVSVALHYQVAHTPVGLVWFFGSNRAAPVAITVSGPSVSAHADWQLISGQGSGIVIPVAAAAPALANTPGIFNRVDLPFLNLCFVYLRTSGGAADLMTAYLLSRIKA